LCKLIVARHLAASGVSGGVVGVVGGGGVSGGVDGLSLL
jgi:hypothetical protein